MMSLFNSFDNFFSPLSMSIYLVFIFLSMNFMYIFSFFNLSLNKLNLMFQDFTQSIKSKSSFKFTSLMIFTIMLMIFYLNFFSVFSFNFPVSSQVSFCLFFSLSIWFTLIIFQNFKNFMGFMYHAIPEGTPIYLTWFLFIIELVSNFIRPITLMVRLVANILAGHLLMILLSKLVLSNLFLIPSYIILNTIEIFVSLIQAYIFVTMISLYYAEMN